MVLFLCLATTLAALVFIAVYLARRSAILLQDTLRALAEKEDTRAATLRTELAGALASSRRELQDSLERANLSLETRVKELNHGVQEKLEKNLKEGFLHFEKVESQLQRAERELI